ncbi:hypothetical protein HK101_000634 [Irineochytrium annulatum]|nr:hypothetical protein HK101_000634 [Irineochytrium annulatum]
MAGSSFETLAATANGTAADQYHLHRPNLIPIRTHSDGPDGGVEDIPAALAQSLRDEDAIAQAAESDCGVYVPYTPPVAVAYDGPSWETKLSEKQRADRVVKTHGAAALIRLWGYPCEVHEVTASDGTRLTLQRIPDRRFGRTRGPELFAPCPLPGVILWHGLGISADVWVCNLEQETNLALVLADAGHDVWLANSRGNHHTSADPGVCDIDGISYMDIPAVVDFVLRTTRRETVAYLGYSQGTTSIFAALSIHEDLNRKINVVIALAPALKPKPGTITNTYLRLLLRVMGPECLYAIFGTGAFLSWTPLLRRYAPAALYAWTTSESFSSLLNWRCERLGSDTRKVALFNHCFGGMSVRNLVQWFQIMSDGPFHTTLHHYWAGAQGKSSFLRPVFNCTDLKDLSFTVKYPTKHITAKMASICQT